MGGPNTPVLQVAPMPATHRTPSSCGQYFPNAGTRCRTAAASRTSPGASLSATQPSAATPGAIVAPTPESVSSDEPGKSTAATESTSSASPFFQLTRGPVRIFPFNSSRSHLSIRCSRADPRARTPRGSHHLRYDTPGLTQLLKDVKKGPPDTKGYPTPASSSSSSAGSASSSAVSIAVEEPRAEEPRVESLVQKRTRPWWARPRVHVIINTPTPNLTPHPSPHPTPPATPFSPHPRCASPRPRSNRRSPLPALPPALRHPRHGLARLRLCRRPKSTHILPLGGRPCPRAARSTPPRPLAASARSIFFIHASASSHSSSRSSNSNSTSCEGEAGARTAENSESSQERDAREGSASSWSVPRSA
ncbi:hypothetical protein B0H17DRAFT_640279 [Mycena rosella]|uniref:Uncharacterized protein n=1 Tax=Mycena rosella TaxID=1033263 RepID=A0AAD7BF38_MYCRO|nr:hypothetical protein B0H17DRAFT_640279 [Mycena rosella]